MIIKTPHEGYGAGYTATSRQWATTLRTLLLCDYATDSPSPTDLFLASPAQSSPLCSHAVLASQQ